MINEILNDDPELEKKDEQEEEEKASKIDISKIHTLYYIKNGVLHRGELDELNKKNYKYRLYSLVEGVGVVDYDKTDARPLVKDILNRTGEFLEIKMLKRNFWMVIAIIAIQIFTLWQVYSSKPLDNTQIIKGMIDLNKKVDDITSILPSVLILSGSTTETVETTRKGYNPIMPSNNTTKLTQ